MLGLATIESITGGSVSVTVTVKLQLAESPDCSVTMHLSVVVPSGNAVPDGGSQTTLGEQSPENVGENVDTAVHAPGSCGLVMFPGQVIRGGVVSTMRPPSGPDGQRGELQPDEQKSASTTTVEPRTRAGIGHPTFNDAGVRSASQVLGVG